MAPFRGFFLGLNMTGQSLQSLVASAVEAEGYELVLAQLSRQGRHGLLQVYIDKEGGVTADDCAKASRQIAAVLEVENPIAGDYRLEVSSPGLDRPLYKKEDYQRFIGREIKLRLRAPEENQRNFSGVLVSLDQDQITLETKLGQKILTLSSIEKANLIPDLVINDIPKKT